MENKLVAVEGCELQLSNGKALSIDIISNPSGIKASRKRVYFGNINVSIKGFSSDKVDTGSGIGVIKPTSLCVNRYKQQVIRVGDVSEEITITGTKDGEPATDIITVTIADAGQLKARAK